MIDLQTMARLFDPAALALVAGGSLAVATLRSTRGDLARAFASLRPLMAARPDLDADAAAQAVGRIEAVASLRTIHCTDRVETAGRFLKRAVAELADARSAESFAAWGQDELARRRRRHEAAIGYWRMVAESAPAMGMIGTVVGLVEMFARMANPDQIGPGMALALLTTLYGVVVAGAMAGPLAARLERLSDLELGWQRSALARLEGLAHAELDRRPAASGQRLRAVS